MNCFNNIVNMLNEKIIGLSPITITSAKDLTFLIWVCVILSLVTFKIKSFRDLVCNFLDFVCLYTEDNLALYKP